MVKLLIAFVLSVIIAFVGIKLFKIFKILDRPGDDQKVKRKPVPTIQGIFAYMGFWIIVGVLFPEYYESRVFLGLLAGTLPIMIVEFVDELNYIGKIKFKTSTYFRLAVHIIGAIIAVLVGGIGITEWTVAGHIFELPNFVFIVLFVIWTVICINSINRFDYANGQATGVSSIGFLTIFLLIKFVVFVNYPGISSDHEALLLMTQNMSFVLFCIALVGTVLEYKPIGLLRDVGTMFFGFSLAYLSVLGGAKIGTLVVALSLVIFDAIWVTIHRVFFVKKDPTQKDYSHLHHRLIGLGRTRAETRVFVWCWSAMMMILMLLQGSNRTGKIIIFVMMASIFFGVNAYVFWVKKVPCGLKKSE